VKDYGREPHPGFTRETSGYRGVIRDVGTKGNPAKWFCPHVHPSVGDAKGCVREEIERSREELLNPGSYPDEIEIRYEDGKIVRLPSAGLPGLLKMAGDGTLDWMVSVFEPMRQEEDNEQQ